MELCSFLKTLCPRSTAGTQTLTRDGETQNVPVPALAHHAEAAPAHSVGVDAAEAQRTRCAEADREACQCACHRFWRHTATGRASTLTGNHAGECAVATVGGSDRGLWAPLIDGRLDRLRSAACPVRACCGRRVRGGAVHDGPGVEGECCSVLAFGLQGYTPSRVGQR